MDAVSSSTRESSATSAKEFMTRFADAVNSSMSTSANRSNTAASCCWISSMGVAMVGICT